MRKIKPILFSVIAIFLALSSFAQDCKLNLYTQGKKVTFDILGYSNTIASDKKFPKMDDDEKVTVIEAYNNKVISGGETPVSKVNFSYDIVENIQEEGSQKIVLQAKVGEQTYTSMALCQNDTMYMFRNVGPVIGKDDAGNVTGITIQGIQELPLRINVGDFLLPYEDISMLVPVERDFTVKYDEFIGTTTKTYIERNTFNVDTRTGQMGFGNWQVTKTENVYKTLDVPVREKSSVSMYTRNYAVAYVSGKEEVDFLGQKYEAYVINSERWAKFNTQTTYESIKQAVVAQQMKMREKVEKKMGKWAWKSGYTNEDGYIVITIREWYVPGLGVVMYGTLDANGAITGLTKVKSIE